MYLYIELLVIEGPAPALLVQASRAGGATRARERVCVCRNTEGLPPSERADGMQRLSFLTLTFNAGSPSLPTVFSSPLSMRPSPRRGDRWASGDCEH